MTISLKSDAGGVTATLQVNGVDTAQFRQKQSYMISGTLTDGATVTWDCATTGQVAYLTTTAARTIAAPSNVVQGAAYILLLTTGGFTPAWNIAFKWPSGGTPSGLVSATYVFTFIGGATNTMIPLGPGYQTGA